MKQASLILLFLLLLVAGGVWIVTSNPAFITDTAVLHNRLKQKQITIRHTLPVTVEVADTNETRVQGLSGRDSLNDGSGLLMVFEEDQDVGIWMKDMKFAIDVIWADSSGVIVNVYANMDPTSYPQVFSAGAPIRYVLEVPAGFTEIHNIQVGDQMQL